MPRLLREEEVATRLKGLAGWRYEEGFIVKSYQFEEFMQGIAFIVEVAKVAEEEEHHPDIHVRYTTVTLSLQTHSEGGVTEWDLELAGAIEKKIGAKGEERRHGGRG